MKSTDFKSSDQIRRLQEAERKRRRDALARLAVFLPDLRSKEKGKTEFRAFVSPGMLYSNFHKMK